MNLGLDQALLEGLLSDCFLRFEQQGYAMPKRGLPPLSAEENGGCTTQLPRRRRTSYEDALKKGRATLRGGDTVEEQVARQKEGAALAAAIAGRLKPVLQAKGITALGFLPYFNFAQKLGRLSRKYADKSLDMAAADLIDYYEAKALAPDILRAIAATLFGIAGLS